MISNPKDVCRAILPPLDRQRELYGRERQRDIDLDPLLEDLVAEVLVFGHLHLPFVRRWERFKLANIGPVSMPADGDARARYAIFSWNTSKEDWQLRRRVVEYDIAPEIAAFRRTRPPRTALRALPAWPGRSPTKSPSDSAGACGGCW